MIKYSNLKRSTLAARPSIDGIVPLPNIAAGLGRSRSKGAIEAIHALQAKSDANEAKTQRRVGLESACEATDGRGKDIAAFLNPVVDRLDLEDDDSAELAAFTRKLLAGGRPKRGSMATNLRNVDLD